MSDDLKAGEAFPPLPGDEGHVPEPPPSIPEDPPPQEFDAAPPPVEGPGASGMEAPREAPEGPAPKSPTRKLTRGTAVRKGTRPIERPTEAKPVQGGPAKPSTSKKVAFFSVPILIAAAIAGGFFLKDPQGNHVWRKIFGTSLPPPPKKDKPPSQMELDFKYDVAWGKYVRAKNFVDGLKRTEENLDQKGVEELDEIVKELTGFRDMLREGLDHIEKVAAELDRALKSPEGTTTLTDKDPKIVFDQQRDYTQFLGRLNGTIVKWTDIADTKAGRTKPVATPPPTMKFEAYKIHPFGIVAAGQWVRHRVDVNLGGMRKTTFRDRAVASRVENGLQLAEVTSDAGGTETAVRFGAGEVKTLPEETLTIGDRAWKCLVVEITETGVTRKLWISQEGRAAGKLVLKEVVTPGDITIEATKVNDGGRTFSVKNVPYAVLEVDFRHEDAQGRSTSTVWYNADFPGRILKRVWLKGEDSVTEEVIDMGNDWGRQPPFPDLSAVPSPSPEPSPSPSPSVEPSPEPSPSPSVSPSPAPGPIVIKRPDPWANRPEGSWIRLRTHLKNQFGESEQHLDAMLKARTDRRFTFVTQSWSQATPGKEETSEPPAPASLKIRVVGEQTLIVDGREIACQIEEFGNDVQNIRQWFDPSGPPVFLKQVLKETPPGEAPTIITTTVTKRGREKLTAAGVEFDCVVVEQTIEGQIEGTIKEKVWWSADCPWGNVKVERWSKPHGKDKYTRTELVAMGDDWSARTPPELREDPKVRAQRALDDADRLKNEAVKLFVEVRDAGRDSWPSTKDELQALLKKARGARDRFKDASMKLDLGRSAAPDLKQLRDTQKQLEELAKMADGYAKELEAKLK